MIYRFHKSELPGAAETDPGEGYVELIEKPNTDDIALLRRIADGKMRVCDDEKLDALADKLEGKP